MKYYSLRTLAIITAIVMSLGAGSLQAASVTYTLTESNDDLGHLTNTGWVTGNIPDGGNYATVTIDDEGVAGLINFTVTVGSFWTGKEDVSFGIDSFGFNVAADPKDDSGLVSGDISMTGDALANGNWVADVDYTGPPGPVGINQDGFGKFDAVVMTSGVANRVAPSLTFSIDNQSNAFDAIADYIFGSVPGADPYDNGSHFFAVHIAGFTDQNPDAPLFDPDGNCPATPDANVQDCNLLVSGWYAGSALQVVPVPAAVWLFGSALGLLGWVRLRKSA
jgi:hypothetical protein